MLVAKDGADAALSSQPLRCGTTYHLHTRLCVQRGAYSGLGQIVVRAHGLLTSRTHTGSAGCQVASRAASATVSKTVDKDELVDPPFKERWQRLIPADGGQATALGGV